MPKRFIGATHLFRDRRVQIRQPFDVGFINHGIAPRRLRRGIVFPVVEIVHHHAFRRDGRAVAVVRFAIANVEQRVVFKLAVDAVRAWVYQQLRRVKPVSLSRLPGAVNAKTVVHPRPSSGQVTMPGIPRARR